MAQRNGRCKTCCEGCDIYSTGYIDDTEGDEVPGFSMVAGAAHQNGGRIVFTESDTRYDCDTAHPDAIPSHYVSWDVGHVCADADEYMIFVGDHYVKLTIGDPNGCLALYETAGDVLLTKMRVSAAANTAHALETWYGETEHSPTNDEQFAARLNDGQLLRINVTRSGNTVGHGVGTIASTAEADNFVYQKHWTPTNTTCQQITSCDVVVDNFTRADSTDLGCGLNETAGAWEIKGNDLATSSSNAICTIETVHPRGDGSYKIATSFDGSSNSDVIKIFPDESDATTYGEFTFGTAGAGRLKVFVGGVEIDSFTLTAVNTADVELTVTQVTGIMSVYALWNNGTTTVSKCLTAAHDNPVGVIKCAIGTGSISGEIKFRSVLVSIALTEAAPECSAPCITCGDCDIVPTQVEVEIADLDNGTCTHCADIEATYVLDFWKENPSFLGRNVCQYRYLFPSPVLLCDAGATIGCIIVSIDGGWRHIQIEGPACGGGYISGTDEDADGDCFSVLAVAFDDGTGACANGTATITPMI